MKKMLSSVFVSTISVLLPFCALADAPKSLAVFVKNDSGMPELNGKTAAFDAMLSAKISGRGFAPMSHDLILRNLNDYLKNPNAQYRSLAENLKKSAEGKDSIDMKLFEDASGLRIAEFIDADFILTLSFATFGEETRIFKQNNVRTVSTSVILRSSYSLLSASSGGGVSGGVVEASKTIRQTENLEIISSDIVNSLLEETAAKISAELDSYVKAGMPAVKEHSVGEVEFRFVIEAMSVPSFARADDGQYKITGKTIPVTISEVVAQIDGVASNIGGKATLSKGIHSLKINQKDIEPIAFNINVTGRQGQSLTVQLNLTDEARKRWKDDLDFIEQVKSRSNISEAEAQRILGIAEMFRNSGYRIDIRADELPNIIQQNQSLMGPMTNN